MLEFFIENLPKKKKKSIHNDFSYQKYISIYLYISGSMGGRGVYTKRENTHKIQICTSCM